MDIQNVQAGNRLDKFLTERLEEYSRTQVQKLIAEEHVLVNGQVANKKQILEEGDSITVDESQLPSNEIFQFVPNPEVTVQVVEETTEFIVVHKTIHQVVHPANAYEHNNTLANGLLAKYPELQQVGDDPMRPGIVHRLDKDVSGLMVIARTPEMFEHLKSQFQQRLVYKRYVALVHGVLSEQEGQINFGIERSSREYTRMAAVPVGQGKDSLTEYEVLQQFQHYALVALHPHTGRTHQIRVHLNAIGHPIVGDKVYHPKKFITRLQPNRICLHAEELRFHDIQEQEHRFTSPIEPDMQFIIDELYAGL